MALKDPEARAAYNREYSKRKRQALNAYTAQWRRNRYATDPAYQESVKAASRATPAHVSAARVRVYRAIKRGELIRPETCAHCGGGGRIEAAHLNYHERLAVIWLCQPCHRTWDMEEPKVLDERRYEPPPPPSHCQHGHEFTEANTYRPPGYPNRRQCRTCRMLVRQKRWPTP